MKKIGLFSKEQVLEEIRKKLKDSQACFFINFNKVAAFSFNVLRNNLTLADAKVFVSKNSLLKKAFKDLGWEDLNGFLGQGTGIVFVYDKDIVKTCKILVDFSKENENLQLKGGFLKTQKITSEELNVLAKLPPKEILLGMVVSGFASPLTSFLSAMNNIILKFVWVIEEIKKTKVQK